MTLHNFQSRLHHKNITAIVMTVNLNATNSRGDCKNITLIGFNSVPT